MRLFCRKFHSLSGGPSLPPPTRETGCGFDLPQDSARQDTGATCWRAGGALWRKGSLGKWSRQAWQVVGSGRDGGGEGAVTEARKIPTNTHIHTHFLSLSPGITGFRSRRCFPLIEELLLHHTAQIPVGMASHMGFL